MAEYEYDLSALFREALVVREDEINNRRHEERDNKEVQVRRRPGCMMMDQINSGNYHICNRCHPHQTIIFLDENNNYVTGNCFRCQYRRNKEKTTHFYCLDCKTHFCGRCNYSFHTELYMHGQIRLLRFARD